MEVRRCKICKKEIIFNEIVARRFLFCKECREKFCNKCKKELTEEELQYLPKRKYFENEYRLCLKCLKKELIEEKDLYLKNINFQIKFQNCISCGEINTSRYGNGKVYDPYCIKCREKRNQEERDKYYLEWLHNVEPKFDKREIVFDKIIGFKYNRKKT